MSAVKLEKAEGKKADIRKNPAERTRLMTDFQQLVQDLAHRIGLGLILTVMKGKEREFATVTGFVNRAPARVDPPPCTAPRPLGHRGADYGVSYGMPCASRSSTASTWATSKMSFTNSSPKASFEIISISRVAFYTRLRDRPLFRLSNPLMIGDVLLHRLFSQVRKASKRDDKVRQRILLSRCKNHTTFISRCINHTLRQSRRFPQVDSSSNLHSFPGAAYR